MIGGDIFRAVGLARDCPSHKQSVYASVAMEKVVALVATLLYAWIGLGVLAWAYPGPTQRTVLSVLALGSLGAAFLIICSLFRRIHDAGVAFLTAVRLGRLAKFVDQMLEAYKAYAQRRRLLATNLLWALLENATQMGTWYVAARETGVTAPALDLVAVIAVAQFVRRAVNYVQGSVVAEVTAVSIYGLIGIEAGQGVAIAVLAHCAAFLASLPGLLVMLRARSLAPDEATAEPR